MIPLNQGDPQWAGKHVGNSSRTYADIGCVLTAITMAVNFLTGRSLAPDQLQPGGKAGLVSGDYVGGSVISKQAFAKLGCKVTGVVEAARFTLGLMSMRAVIDTALEAKQLVLMRVDYDLATPETNHTITCFAKTDEGDYLAADPAGGKVITIVGENLTCQRTKTKLYSVVNLQTVAKAD